MDFDKYNRLPTIEPSDIMDHTTDYQKEMAAMRADRGKFYQKYIDQQPYKKGDKVMINHRKKGWEKAKVKNVGVNSLNGNYEYSFKNKRKKFIPNGHVIDISPI